VVTVLALVVVAAIFYFGSKRPEAKPTTSDPMARPSVSTSTPVAIIIPSPSPKPPTSEVAVQPSAQPTAPVAVAIPSPSISATPTKKEELARRSLDNATKDHPWTNSLGMRFVPVAGIQVLFSVWDTRVEDFEMLVKSTGYDATEDMYSIGKEGWEPRGATWQKPGFKQGSTDPVVGVSWEDAKAFCEWLKKREHDSGLLPKGMYYRLPTDQEWSAAVGLKNEVGSTPAEKSGTIKLYPWDIPQKRAKSWPPPSESGNYCGEESRIGKEPQGLSLIKGYNDSYARTSPVGSSAANRNGLYDMGGNVQQWCEDLYDEREIYRTLRGASWINDAPGDLLTSSRFGHNPDDRFSHLGFRCVVAVESSR
jgi:formylglycine-generating enzyme required for sulfatase activity